MKRKPSTPVVPAYLGTTIVSREEGEGGGRLPAEYRNAIDRAHLLANRLIETAGLLLRPGVSDDDRRSIVLAIDRAWESFHGARDKHARVSLIGAIDDAAQTGLDADGALGLLGVLYPDLASRLARADVRADLQREIELARRGTGRPRKGEGRRARREERIAALLGKVGERVSPATIADEIKDWRARSRGKAGRKNSGA